MTQRLPCLLCQQTYLNADTVVAHYRRDHKLSVTSADVYGTRCPACGESFERLGQHSSRVHHRQIALLFADMRVKDPHGVVAARVKDLFERSVAQLEGLIMGAKR